jgi:hypothetical protein
MNIQVFLKFPMKIMFISCYFELEPFYRSVMMNGAAPEGTPPRRISDYSKKILARRTSKETLRAGSIVYCIIFMVWVRT